MRLIPKMLDGMTKDDPFMGDQLGREPFGEALFNLVSRVDDNLVIALDAPWGEGKTVFVKMWSCLLEQKKAKSIYFDAFANDYIDDPFMAITSNLTSFFKKEACSNVKIKKSLHTFLGQAKKTGVKLAGIGTQIALNELISKLTLGSDLGSAKKALREGSTVLIEDIVESRLKSFDEDRKTIELFRKKLESLAGEIQRKTGCPLVFIVDELDRCKPPYALDFIEKIKHFFSVNNIVFILVLNREQLERSIKSAYGPELDANIYLQKFVNIECRLPKNKDKQTGTVIKYCNSLLSMHELENNRFAECIVVFDEIFDLSLRELERVFSYISLYLATLNPEESYDPSLISFLSIIKTRNPEVFNLFRMGDITFDQLKSILEITDVKNLEEKAQPFEWVFGILKFFLMTDDSVEKLENFKIYQNHYYLFIDRLGSRRNILRFVCNRFESFKFTDSKDG